MNSLIPVERIERRIFLLRGQKVMLSSDLAFLYGVAPKVLVQAVKRNIERFPEDFMFQISQQEFAILKSQIVTSSWGGLRRALPYAFTEQGVAMLSSVLRSKRAIEVNIAIIRVFVRFREMIATHKDLAMKLAELERKVIGHGVEIRALFDAIRAFVNEPEKPKRRIGFRVRGKT